jgi:hypothetical protein
MKGRVRALAIASGSAVVTAALVMMATAGSGAAPQQVGDAQPADQAEVPEGPFIDFCPTTEQIEAHLEKYGFDYKPTVACGENGEELEAGESQPVDVDIEREALREALLTATRAPDTDGDPLTMEVVLADGTEVTIQIFGDPKLFEDMTPANLARGDFPKEVGSP